MILNHLIKRPETMSFFIEEIEVDVSEINIKLISAIDYNNIECALEVQKLFEDGWRYGKPAKITSSKKKNIIKNYYKRLGIKK